MIKFCLLFLFVFLLEDISGSVLRSRRQTDECSALDVNPQCDPYWGGQEHPPLLIISLDGFRSDYLDRELNGESAAPTLNRLARCGVWASSGMMPSYPTMTFPNHFSIVTGLYPESHGIVDNSFYDPNFGAAFSLSSPQQTNSLWWNGEPIWTTVKKQDKISATYFWPGSDKNDPNKEPNYWYRYDGSVPFRDRVVQVLKWLQLPISQRPNFLSLYFDEPDHTAHDMSPDSPLVNDEIFRVDQEVKFLLDGLEQEGILGCIDIIVLADHGMAPSPNGTQFYLMENLIPGISNQARIYDGVGPNIRPNVDTEEEQDRIAAGFECQDVKHMRVYNKWELPRRHHYYKSSRIPSLRLDMSLSWRAYRASEFVLRGNHGWDNLNSEMQALFLAQGPSFKKSLKVRPFQNIELYNLMCAMIGVEPSPNNGTWGALHHFLVSPPADPAPPIVPQTQLPYPADDATYQDHLNRKKCSLLTGTNTQVIDGSLNLDPTAVEIAIEKHTPWGSPQFDAGSESVKVVTSTDYISGFDIESGLPVWTSYTLRQPVPLSSPDLPWRLDVRLERESSSICDRVLPTGSLVVPIFPFRRSATEADMAVDTNAIDVSPSFLKYWTDFHEKLSTSVASNGETNVVIGPIRDTSSPSLFVIVSNCGNYLLSECPVDRLEVQSFILPTRMKHNNACLGSDDFFATHLAMLRDISQITGLRFFPAISYRNQVDLLSRTPFASDLLANPDPYPETD